MNADQEIPYKCGIEDVEQKLDPYIDLMLDFAEIMIAMKKHLETENENARNQNGRDQALDASREESAQDL